MDNDDPFSIRKWNKYYNDVLLRVLGSHIFYMYCNGLNVISVMILMMGDYL